ncbi:MAG: hypothetical protein AVDCRST_MAG47-599, partial [uncultured Nocardioidaceae bacterium]
CSHSGGTTSAPAARRTSPGGAAAARTSGAPSNVRYHSSLGRWGVHSGRQAQWSLISSAFGQAIVGNMVRSLPGFRTSVPASAHPSRCASSTELIPVS